MKVIKIKFEYGCFPVWIYGENNEWIENDLPPYLIGDSDIEMCIRDRAQQGDDQHPTQPF